LNETLAHLQGNGQLGGKAALVRLSHD
jgi:hypothetical protein